MKKILVFTLIVPLLLAGCGDNSRRLMQKIQFSFKNLPVLQNVYYTAWLTNKTEKIMLEKFRLDEDGNMLNINGKKKIKDNILYSSKPLSDFKEIKIVLAAGEEEDINLNNSPLILSGAIDFPLENIKLQFSAVDLANISGKYHLGVVSDDKLKNNPNGIWFADVINDVQTPGLKIPPTSVGWIYEGWIKREDQYLSLGQFGGPYEKDLSNIYSTNLLAIKYAGEDFLNNAPAGYVFPLNLADGKIQVVISLQPYADGQNYFYQQPFLEIFSAKIPKNLKTWQAESLKNTVNDMPSGSISALND